METLVELASCEQLQDIIPAVVAQTSIGLLRMLYTCHETWIENLKTCWSLKSALTWQHGYPGTDQTAVADITSIPISTSRPNFVTKIRLEGNRIASRAF